MLLLEALALRDITRDLGRTHDAAGGVFDGRHRDRHAPELAALGHADGLEVVGALASSNSGGHLVLLGAPFERNDQSDVLPDRLHRCPTEESLGRVVPARDDAIEHLADNDLVRGVHDGGKP